MDSMRNLSTSLPTPRHQNNSQPSQQTQNQQDLGSAFRSAALSVTNLYKTAALEQSKARSTGYQDALDDLLHFLDERDIGLDDGEGWRVRQWATERYEGGGASGVDRGTSEDGDEGMATATESRSSSPEIHRKPAVTSTTAAAASQLPSESTMGERTPPQHSRSPQPSLTPRQPSPRQRSPRQQSPRQPSPQQQQQHQPQSQMAYNPPTSDHFAFRSSHVYPSSSDLSMMDTRPSTTDTETSPPTSNAPNADPQIRLVPRQRQRNHRRGPKGSSRTGDAATINFNLGSGAGSKRKMQLPDIFDIPGFDFDGAGRDRDGSGGNGKDGGGGGRPGKRGKFV